MQALAEIHSLLPPLASLGILLLAALLGQWLTHRVLLQAVRRYAHSSAATWDDALVQFRVFARLSQLAPAFIIYQGVDLLPDLGATLAKVLTNLASAYMIMVLTFTVTAVLSAGNHLYGQHPQFKQRPIKGLVQLLQLLVLILGSLLFVAALLDRSAAALLGGFGAMTAILLLVFRDTILSLVASVQITAHDMVAVGDWIEMPQFGADGDVVDLELHTIKVQNWDKTITTIPTHRLISDSFKNWRGMSSSGGRRIKRALHLDISSIGFLTETEVERFKQWALLEQYIGEKQLALREYNRGLLETYQGQASANVNLRRLTNVGTFRAYAYHYLQHHPRIHRDMTLLVRQCPPGSEGLPLELYCFTNTTDWNEYEDIQSDIFDHLLAVAPEFGLRLYQLPAGSDFSGHSAKA